MHILEGRFKSQPSKFLTQWTRKKEKIKINISRKKKKRFQEKGTTENKTTGWHYWRRTWVWANSRRRWRTGNLACCSPWGHRESNMTEQLNNNNKEHKSIKLKIRNQQRISMKPKVVSLERFTNVFSLKKKKFVLECSWFWSFPGGSVVKNPPADTDVGLIPVSGRSPGEGNRNPLLH